MSDTRRNLWIAFGIILPVLCFTFDPGVMSGDFSFGPMQESPLFVYCVAGLGMAAMLAWLVVGRRSDALDAGIAGVLFVAGAVAALMGLSILPFSPSGSSWGSACSASCRSGPRGRVSMSPDGRSE